MKVFCKNLLTKDPSDVATSTRVCCVDDGDGLVENSFMSDLDEQLFVNIQAAISSAKLREDLYVFDLQHAWELTGRPEFEEGAIRAVELCISQHPKLTNHLGLYLNAIFNGGHFTSGAVTKWLCHKSIEVGPKVAFDRLLTFIDEDVLCSTNFIAFSGISIPKTVVQLPFGLELVPFSFLRESSLTISLLDPQWKGFSRTKNGSVVRRPPPVELFRFGDPDLHYLNPPIPSAALRQSISRSPALVEKVKLEKDADGVSIQQHLTRAVQLFSVATYDPVLPLAVSSQLSENAVDCGSIGWADNRPYIGKPMFQRPVRDIELHMDRIQSILQNWFRLGKVTKTLLDVPIERFNKALMGQPVDMAIDLGIALEALLLGDNDSRDQLALSFRLRGAWLLGKDANEREKLVNIFKAIYACRCDAVHAGHVGSVVKVGKEKVPIHDFFYRLAIPTAADAIYRIISLGRFPDWQTLILGK